MKIKASQAVLEIAGHVRGTQSKGKASPRTTSSCGTRRSQQSLAWRAVMGMGMVLLAALMAALPGQQALADDPGLARASDSGFTRSAPKGEYFSADVPQAIDLAVNGGTAVSTLNVADARTVEDLNLTINITYPNDGDLVVSLESPEGTLVQLFAYVGGTGSDFTDTTLDDDADVSIDSGTAPFAGSYIPQASLSGFDGQDTQGVWTLYVTTTTVEPLVTGELNGWSLLVDYPPPA